nr:exonuclease domain-containing protein [Arthrobacter sp. zg-Y20]
MNFTAIDVETANNQRASVCAVGIVQVRNGKISETFEWHVTPPTGLDSFHPRNIAIHGITPEIVRAADNTWADSLDAIQTLAEDHPLVAYNAPFDKSVLHASSLFSGLTPPSNDFHCALALAKRLLTMEKYRLPLVAAELGLDSFTHHDAGSDAAACAQIVLALSERHGLRTVADLWTPAGGGIRTEQSLRPSAFSRGNKSPISELPQPDPAADPSHPFFGRQVIMTGDLVSYSRWDAMEKIASLGGINGKGVTKKTAFLLVGDGKTHASVDLENGTTKEKKAAAYMAAGQDLTVLTESDFLQLVSSDAPAVLEPDMEAVSDLRPVQTRDATTDEAVLLPSQHNGSFEEPAAAAEWQYEDPDGQYASPLSDKGAPTDADRSDPFMSVSSDAIPEKAGQAVTALLKAGSRMGQRLWRATRN